MDRRTEHANRRRRKPYGVTLSLPGIVGRKGCLNVLYPPLSDVEGRAWKNALKRSVKLKSERADVRVAD
jgi:hypothetical protein